MEKPLPVLNHELIQHLAADVHALRAAVLAVACQLDSASVLLHYDAATQALLNQKLFEPSSDDYQALIAEAGVRLRAMLVTATAGTQAG